MLDIHKLLKAVVAVGASDLHLAASNPPVARVNGALKMVQGEGTLSPQDLEEVLEAIASPRNVETFKRGKELDFSYSQPGLTRFRVNVCYQRGSIGLSFRVLPREIPSPEELGLPPVCLDLVNQLQGLVLVTGPTGSGKSTTLAAMVDHINKTNSMPHYHTGGPHRIPSSEQAKHDYSARDGRGHPLIQGVPAAGPPAGPRRDHSGRAP